MVSFGKGRFSSHLLKQALLQFYATQRLYPSGMTSSMECVETWALRNGLAMQRLVSSILLISSLFVESIYIYTLRYCFTLKYSIRFTYNLTPLLFFIN